MEPTNEFGMHYVRENGRLYVCTENSISPGFKSIKRIKYRDSPLEFAILSNSFVRPHDNILSLFDLCLVYLSTNVRNIDSLVGFPDAIGEKIFAAVRNRGILRTFADHECALVLQIFDEAYRSSLLEELSVKSLVVLEQHIECFSSFNHITKLDISGCMLGDNHDYLLHIGHLSHALMLLSGQPKWHPACNKFCFNSLSKNTAVSNNGLRKLTTPARMFGKGPMGLIRLDVSHNSGISSRCGKYLQVFKHLKLLNVTGTAVKLSDVSELTAALNLVVSGTRSADVEMKCSSLGNVGWAAEIVNDWNAVDPHPPAVKMLSSSFRSVDNDSSQLQCGVFYSKQIKSVSMLETAPLPQSDNCLVLICPAAEPVNELTHTQKTLSASNHRMTSCTDSVDALCNESSEQWTNVYNVYGCKTNATRTSSSVGKAGSGLLSAMNSSAW